MRSVLVAVGIMVGSSIGWPMAESPVDSWLAQAQAAEARLDRRAALELCLQAERLQPNHAGLLQLISRYYSEMVEHVAEIEEKQRLCVASLDYARRAQAAAPGDPVNVLSVSVAYGKLSLVSPTRLKIDYASRAHDFAQQSLVLDPDYALAHHVLGEWNLSVATLNAPSRWWARLIGKLPAASTAAAVQHLTRATLLAPDVPAHHAALGFALLADGQATAAQAAFERALALPPRDDLDRRELQRVQDHLKTRR